MDIRPPKKPEPVENFNEPAFVEPEAIAESEDRAQASAAPARSFAPKVAPRKSGPLSKIKNSWSNFGPKQKIALIVLAIILFAGASFTAYSLTKSDPAPPAPEPAVETPVVVEPPKPTTEASKLTGVQISPELNQRSVTGVMIENSMDARPQAGLKDAGVVFEAIAEGGITRFLALFQESQPDYIGPVRSARPYYIDWLMGFDAAYAHAGGSGEALALIKQIGVKDMDHGGAGGSYQRVSNRYAPHNLYTSTSSLDALKASRGYTTSKFTPLARATQETPVSPATTTKIDINPSSGLYAVHYDYDATTNSYKRVLGGKPHTDERSGTQLSPKVVVAWVVPYSIHADRVHSAYGTIGSGKVFIFQNGTKIEGTWSKADRTSQIQFKDASGNPIALSPGQTWFTAVSSADRITSSAQ